jgi:hypothetical protein
MPRRFSDGPRDNTIASYAAYVQLNQQLAIGDSYFSGLPAGPDRRDFLDELSERDSLLRGAPGFGDVMGWIKSHLGLLAYDPAAVVGVQGELARRLSVPVHETGKLSFAEAAVILNQAEPPPAGKALAASVDKAPADRQPTPAAARAGDVLQADLPPWLRSLADLRARFATRADDDLHLLLVRSVISPGCDDESWADESLHERALALPENPDWSDGKPIVRDVNRGRYQTERGRDETGGPVLPGTRPPFIRTRYVIFGTADASALADFERWADRAGGCMAARPTAKVDVGDRYTWMDYVLWLAVQRVPGCPLRAATWSDPVSRASLLPFDGPDYGALTPNLFQASVGAIDTIVWNREKLWGGTAVQPPRPADPSPPPAERPENEARAPAAPGNKAPAELLVILRGQADEPIVRGKRKDRLTVARYNIVKTLMEAGEDGLSGDDLVSKSKHGGAVNTLKALANQDEDWGSVIVLPRGPGKRYRLRLTDIDGS